MIKIEILFKKYIIILATTILFALLYTIFVPDYHDWIGINKEEDVTFGDKFFNRLYFSLATTSTVGYGDIIPVTDLGRVVAMFYMFFGIAIAGIFISIIGTRYYKKRVEPKENQEITYEKKILERIDDLENSVKEIRDILKQGNVK